jgi:hypothetical protein
MDLRLQHHGYRNEAQILQDHLYTIASQIPKNERANAIQYNDSLVQKYDEIEKRLIELGVPYTSPLYGANNATPSEEEENSVAPLFLRPPPPYYNSPQQPRHRRAGTPPRPMPPPSAARLGARARASPAPPRASPAPPRASPAPPRASPAPPGASLPVPPRAFPAPPPNHRRAGSIPRSAQPSAPNPYKPLVPPLKKSLFTRLGNCVGRVCFSIKCPVCYEYVLRRSLKDHLLDHNVGKHIQFWINKARAQGGTRRRRKSKKAKKQRKTIRKQ